MSRRWWLRLLCVFLGWLLVSLAAHLSEARPRYKNVFGNTYPKVAEKKTTCNVCHFGDSKKNRNHYGEALAKELGGKKNVMDEEKIKKALTAIEDGDCKTGKWKQRLEESQWPCTCETNKHDSESYINRLLERDRTE